jgi:hypothetical protein
VILDIDYHLFPIEAKTFVQSATEVTLTIEISFEGSEDWTTAVLADMI